MLKRDLNFQLFESTGWLAVSVAAVVCAAVLMVVLLRYERKLVRQRVGYALLILRLSVIAVAFLALLEPVLTWTLDREQTGRVLVAVDVSRSMSTADAHASEAEKLRWARALGMIGNREINQRLDRWLKAYEDGREPEWVDEHETSDPERRRQLTAVRKQNLESVFEEIDRLPRTEIARRLLTGGPSPLLARLQATASVELRVFAGNTAAADAERLPTLIADPPKTLLGDVSDLSQPLSSTPSAHSSLPPEGTEAATATEGTPLLGVVLLTDGRDNAGNDPLSRAARLGQSSVPVYPVLMGSERRPKDLAIARLEHPQTVFRNDHPLLKATLSTAGFDGQQVRVVVEREGQETASRTLQATGTPTTVQFELEADDVGRHEFTVRTDVQPGETRADNNQKSFSLNVVDDRVRVLLVDGEARWEFRFIDNALSRDERVEIQSVLFRQPYLGVLPENFFPRKLDLPDRSDDLANSPFADVDLVIIGDVAPGDIPAVGWELLEKFVSESGGTAVFLAGKRHFPLDYNSPILDRLLPVSNLRPVSVDDESAVAPPTKRGFHLQLTPEGESEPMFQFAGDPAENRAVWAALPGHTWGLFGEAKPGATVFAHGLRPQGEAALKEQRQNAVIVHQYYGFGQVLWLGIDSTWRWRHLVGDQYHHRFWGQLGRWAAENKVTAGNEFVRFGPEQTDIEVGEGVMVRARWTQQFLRRFPELTARVRIDRLDDALTPPPSPPGRGVGGEGEPFSIVDLNPVETRPLVHEARLASLPAGRYRLTLDVQGADLAAQTVAAPLYVHAKQTSELSDLSANRPLLSQLAEASGGRLFLPDELDQLTQQFQQPALSETLRTDVELWDHWAVMAAFFGLLTIEWIIRKLNGLP